MIDLDDIEARHRKALFGIEPLTDAHEDRGVLLVEVRRLMAIRDHCDRTRDELLDEIRRLRAEA